MERPFISIITPVGPRHHQHVKVARASLDWQTIPRSWWEHIVIPDTHRRGPAACRNIGIQQARGLFTVFLDADDYLIPQALETYIRGYAAGKQSYVFCDNYVVNGLSVGHLSSSQEYNQANMARYNQHVITAFVPTAIVRAVGGFDEAIDAWEDWTLWLRMAIRGYCGERIPAPALVYRTSEGDRMSRFLSNPTENVQRMAAVTSRYVNREGKIEMACCGGRDPAPAFAAQQMVQALPGLPLENGSVRLQYVGPQQGGFQVRSPFTGQTYKGGYGRLVDVPPEYASADVPWLMSFQAGGGNAWRPVPKAAPWVPPPAIYDESADLSLSELEADALVETR